MLVFFSGVTTLVKKTSATTGLLLLSANSSISPLLLLLLRSLSIAITLFYLYLWNIQALIAHCYYSSYHTLSVTLRRLFLMFIDCYAVSFCCRASVCDIFYFCIWLISFPMVIYSSRRDSKHKLRHHCDRGRRCDAILYNDRTTRA